ncbi:hypothetical protein GQ53DRAFT_143504 [Thozetella sp. PMI_491]|nr:hypothetical protein GQ53DRAFT_143504 [Thozetella sp. PMI_491]
MRGKVCLEGETADKRIVWVRRPSSLPPSFFVLLFLASFPSPATTVPPASIGGESEAKVGERRRCRCRWWWWVVAAAAAAAVDGRRGERGWCALGVRVGGGGRKGGRETEGKGKRHGFLPRLQGSCKGTQAKEIIRKGKRVRRSGRNEKCKRASDVGTWDQAVIWEVTSAKRKPRGKGEDDAGGGTGDGPWDVQWAAGTAPWTSLDVKTLREYGQGLTAAIP